MNVPRDTESWEVPESEITDWILQIGLFGIENVRTFRVRAMGYPMYERDAMILAYGEVLRDHVVVTERVTAWRSIIPVVQSHGPPVHPFDSEQHSLVILDGTPYIPADAPDDTPALDAHEYEQWLQATFRREQRLRDKEASTERNVLWHQIRQDPHHEPEDGTDFLRSKRDNEAEHDRARRDEPNDHVYNHTSPVGPSGSTTTMPASPYHPLDLSASPSNAKQRLRRRSI